MRALDTNTLIYFLSGDPDVSRALTAWREAHEVFVVSTLVQAELLSLPRLTAKDIERIEGLLGTMLLIPVDASVARLAAEFRRRYRVQLADAVIAATAFLRDVPLVTRNVKDFSRIQDIDVQEI